MDHTQKLLQAIVENGRVGEDACAQLLTRAQDMAIRHEMMIEKQHYASAVRDAEARLYEMGARPHPKGPAARAGMWMGMQMNTMMDKSAAHIAEITIQGATMGVVELTRARNTYSEASADAQGIASWLLTRQQEAIDRLKGFLVEREIEETPAR